MKPIIDVRSKWNNQQREDINPCKVEVRRKRELFEMAKCYQAENDCTFEEAKRVVGLYAG